MKRFKGSAPFILGFMVIILITVFFMLDKTIYYEKEISISSSSWYAYSVVNSAELMKRSVEGSALFAAKKSVGELAARGGGSSIWESDGPTLESLQNSFVTGIESSLKRIDFDSISENTVKSNEDGFIISIHNVSDTGFVLSGEMPFSVKNSERVRVEASAAGKFFERIDTPYFKAVRVGREIMGSGEWVWTERELIMDYGENSFEVAGVDRCSGSFSNELDEGSNKVLVVGNILDFSSLCGFAGESGLVELERTSPVGERQAEIVEFYENLAGERLNATYLGLEDRLSERYGFNVSIVPSVEIEISGESLLVKNTPIVSLIDSGSRMIGESDIEDFRFTFKTEQSFELDYAG